MTGLKIMLALTPWAPLFAGKKIMQIHELGMVRPLNDVHGAV